MLGQPISMLLPEVVGFRLTGQLTEGATATDLVLRVTEMLREHGVVGKFVEFYGPGLDDMPVANRATIANMAPSTEPPSASSRSTIRRSSTSGSPGATRSWSRPSSSTTGSRASGGTTPATSLYTPTLELDMARCAVAGRAQPPPGPGSS